MVEVRAPLSITETGWSLTCEPSAASAITCDAVWLMDRSIWAIRPVRSVWAGVR